jgi:DNA-binding CsgD family transcriptional regulator
MLDDIRFADLIGQAYDAALGQEDWAVMLERLSGVLGGDSSVVLQRSARLGRPGQAVRVRADPDYVPLFDRYYRDLCPILPMLGALPSGSVFVDFMMIPEATLMRTEYRTDYALPQDRYSSLYWTDTDGRGAGAYLTGWRSRRRPGWGGDQIRLLRHLGPHLSRALSIERRLADTAAAPDGGRLSPRERDCLAQVARGRSSKQIARLLDLSAYTVDEYVASTMRKLGAASRTEAVALALSRGLLQA